jgi:hypothetical protein
MTPLRRGIFSLAKVAILVMGSATPARVAHQIRNAVVTDVRRAVQSAVVAVETVLVGILAANITAHRLAGVSNDEYEPCSNANPVLVNAF